jgi:competence protein ComGC
MLFEIFMKPHCSTQRNRALTLFEVLVTIAILMFLMAIILPQLAISHNRYPRISCVNYLKELDLAARIWEGDHGNQYPMDVSVTNGGVMEPAAAGNAAITFQIMSNELSTPKILLCPSDDTHTLATNFTTDFSAKNISYFVNLNATEANPQLMLFGDDNFETAGVPVKSGSLLLSTNTPLTWSPARHRLAGNIALTDGSVQQLTTSGLQQVLTNSGPAINRFLIP